MSKPQQQAAGNPSKGEKGIIFHAASAFLSWTKNPLFLSNGSDMQRTIPVMHCDNPLFTDDIVCQEDISLLESPLGGSVVSPSTPEGSSGLHKLTRCNSHINFLSLPPAEDVLEAAASWMRHMSQSCPGAYPEVSRPSAPSTSAMPPILQKAESSIAVTAGRKTDWDHEELGLFYEDEGELCGWLWDILPECSHDILTEEEERWARGLGLITVDLHVFKREQEVQWLWEVLPECLDVLTEEEERWAREIGLLADLL